MLLFVYIHCLCLSFFSLCFFSPRSVSFFESSLNLSLLLTLSGSITVFFFHVKSCQTPFCYQSAFLFNHSTFYLSPPPFLSCSLHSFLCIISILYVQYCTVLSLSLALYTLHYTLCVLSSTLYTLSCPSLTLLFFSTRIV